MKTASAAPFRQLPVPGGLRAGAYPSGVVWFGPNFSAPARVRSSKDGPQRSHAPAACEPPHSGAWPLYVFPAKWSAKCYAPPHSGSAGAGDRLCLRLSSAVLRALRIGRMGICVHSTLWLQARIGMKPDAASGRCVQLRLCPTRLPRGHRKITRSNTKATSDLHSEKDHQIMKPHYNTAKARHIGAESSSTRSSIAKRALQLAKALRRSEITHFR